MDSSSCLKIYFFSINAKCKTEKIAKNCFNNLWVINNNENFKFHLQYLKGKFHWINNFIHKIIHLERKIVKWKGILKLLIDQSVNVISTKWFYAIFDDWIPTTAIILHMFITFIRRILCPIYIIKYVSTEYYL